MTEPVIDVRLTTGRVARQLRTDVLTGLTAAPKWLPPKWLYDARGSELFERITRLPEYYPTRTERELLTTHGGDIAAVTGAASVIELGSGSAEKARLLLDPLAEAGSLREYVPLDVSEPALRAAAAELAVEYPAIRVHGIVEDFSDDLAVPASPRPRLVAFLGSTIGNLLPDERVKFFASVRAALDPGDWLLLGTDLVKSPTDLVPAYDDAAGVTAEFNRNVLRVLNRELGADFAVDRFGHRAVWDADNEWIEMRLRAAEPMRVRIPAIELEVGFDRGEELRTEISAKFRRDGVATELRAAGFTVRHWWSDPRHRFALSLATKDAP